MIATRFPGWGASLRAGMAVLLAVSCSAAFAAKTLEGYDRLNKDEADEQPWVEMEYRLPPMPQDANLLPIEIGSLTTNKFAVDELSVSYDKDGVIRYTLVVTSPSGVRNVSYEGIRCEAVQRRLYAFGRPDGSWAAARNSTWVRIEGNSLNRQHAALHRDYFCKIGSSVSDTAGAIRVLRHGNPGALGR